MASFEFPAIGLALLRGDRHYAFVAKTAQEMRETPWHLVWRGLLRSQYFVDRNGRRINVTRAEICGIDWLRLRQVGWITSLVSAVFSGLNIPVLLRLETTPAEDVALDDLRTELKRCVRDHPRYYTLKFGQAEVIKRLDRAKSFDGLIAVIAN